MRGRRSVEGDIDELFGRVVDLERFPSGTTIQLPTYADTILAEPALLAYWPCNEIVGTTGPTLDASNSGFDLPNLSGVTRGLSGPFVDQPSETSQTGSSDDTFAPSALANTTDDTLTVECWVYPTSTPVTGVRILNDWAGTGVGITTAYALQMRSDRQVYLNIGDAAGGELASVATIALNTWTQIVATYEPGANLEKLYFNGALVATRTGPASLNAGAKFMLGGGEVAAGFQTWLGRICQVSVYSTVLDAATVAAHYTAGIESAATVATVVTSLAKSGSPGLTGDVTLSEGSNVTLTQTGQQIEIAAASSSGIPATIVDAKGDLIAASAADTVARLPVGSNDQVLVADSGQTLGIKWAAVPGTSAFIPVATIDAKGDLLVGSANDAVDNLAVGSNNQVLTADSGQTLGVKWATPSAGAGVAGDSIWDAKGDLAVASGADAASRLPVGVNDQVLVVDSGQTLGVKWGTVPSGSGGALTLLSTTTLGADGTIDVTGISGAYNDLVMALIVRSSYAGGANDSLRITLNGITTNIYYQSTVRHNGGTAAAGTENFGVANWAPTVAANGGTAGVWSMFEFVFLGYASTTWHKVALAEQLSGGTYASGVWTTQRHSFGWASTAAITQITIRANNVTNLLAGSTLRIYGRT